MKANYMSIEQCRLVVLRATLIFHFLFFFIFILHFTSKTIKFIHLIIDNII